jgi:hypothetical protein
MRIDIRWIWYSAPNFFLQVCSVVTQFICRYEIIENK